MPPWRHARDGGPPVRTAVTEAETQQLERLAAGKRVLEIGSYEGWSTVVLARQAKELTSVDPSPDEDLWAKLWDNLRAYGVADDVRVLRQRSQEALPRLYRLDERYDLVFIDGDHEEPTVAHDALWGEKLAPGGVLAFHDCDDGMREVRAVFERLYGSPDEAVDSLWIKRLS